MSMLTIEVKRKCQGGLPLDIGRYTVECVGRTGSIYSLADYGNYRIIIPCSLRSVCKSHPEDIVWSCHSSMVVKTIILK